MPQLTLTFVGRTVGVYELNRERLTIGRRPNNDLQIDNLAVSGHHAVVHRTDEGYVIEDVGSTNGTFVNEVSIQRHVLHPGDVLRIGKHELFFSDPKATPQRPAAQENSVVAAMMADTSISLPLGDHSIPGVTPSAVEDTSHLPPAAIRILNGSRRGTELRLDHARTRLGRPGKPNAVITRTFNGYTVNGIENSGDVLVNDQSAALDHLLENRDLIEIAGFQVEFYYLS
ncbi:putative FHA domain-containing protein [Gammaproteobacteria bacterium]